MAAGVAAARRARSPSPPTMPPGGCTSTWWQMPGPSGYSRCSTRSGPSWRSCAVVCAVAACSAAGGGRASAWRRCCPIAPAPEAPVQRRDLLFDLGHRPEHLHRLLPARKDLAAGQVERRVLGVVAGQLQQPLLAHAVDEPADVCPVLRAGAHGAGFDGGDQRAVPQQVGRELPRGVARQHGFGMVDAVDVALLEQHRLAVGRHQQRAEGVVPGVHRRRWATSLARRRWRSICCRCRVSPCSSGPG